MVFDWRQWLKPLDTDSERDPEGIRLGGVAAGETRGKKRSICSTLKELNFAAADPIVIPVRPLQGRGFACGGPTGFTRGYANYSPSGNCKALNRLFLGKQKPLYASGILPVGGREESRNLFQINMCLNYLSERCSGPLRGIHGLEAHVTSNTNWIHPAQIEKRKSNHDEDRMSDRNDSGND